MSTAPRPSVRGDAGGAARPSSLVAPEPRFRIVVAVGDPMQRARIVEALAPLATIDAVADDAAAVDALRRHPCDLLLADAAAPSVDGLALLRRVRASVALKGLPVLLRGGYGGDGAPQSAFAAGADDWLAPALDGPALLSRAASGLALGRSRLQALVDERSKYRLLFDALDEGFCIVEVLFGAGRPVDYRFVEVNAAFEHQTGLVDAVGRTMRELAPAHEAHWFEIYGGVATTGAPVRFEQPARQLGDRWYEVYAFRVGAPADHLVAILFKDVSARKRSERSLTETQQRLQDALATARMAYWTWDPASDEMTASPTVDDVFGLRPGERPARGESAFAMLHPDDRERHRELITLASAHGEGWHDEYRIVRPCDGRVAWLEEHATMAPDPATGTPRLTGLVWEITERRRAQDEVRHRAEQFQALLDQAPLGVYLVDADFRIAQVNPVARAMFGDIADLVGRDFDEVLRLLWAPGYADEIARTFRRTLATGEPHVEPERVEPRIDRTAAVHYEWRVDRIPLPDGRHGVVCYFRDVSTHVRTREALRETDRRKDEFLATLAHELRNPLAPVRNAVEILKMRAFDDPQLDALRDIIDRQTAHMARLVDDLLEVSRITRGKLSLRRERITLERVINEALETARPHAGHRLEVSLPDEPLELDADPTRLAQVFSNLLDNAAKFTPKGGLIALSAERQGNGVVVRVRDDGIGIPGDDLPRVFDTFTQVGAALNRAHGGLGIGLSLSKSLVEMHGGSIEARSDGLGLGSEFTVRLPGVVGGPSDDGDGESASTALAPVGARRILVVDDNPDSVNSLALLLRLDGSEVATAADGLEAVEKANLLRPDIVVLDIGLPRMSGYDACRAIRAQPWGRDAVVVALTGWGQDDDRRKSAEAGFDGHLVKPVGRAALEAAIAEARRRHDGAPAPPDRDTPAGPHARGGGAP